MSEPLRVLMVEDSEDDFELLQRELRKGGYDLFTQRVETLEAMTVALDSQSWELVISDWSMPKFSALGALQVLKESGVDIPFIIVSGTIGEDTAVDALKAGANDFMVKDHLARLVPAVERELREARFRREHNKMREQLMISDRMASVGLLAAGVAHEINNPLACVMANIDVALQSLGETDGEQAPAALVREVVEQLSDVREAADRIRAIVRDLKLFSRSDEEVSEAVDVQRAMESALRMAWNEIRHRARLVKNFTPVPPVVANESRLCQVFLNLIINAAQSIQEGRAESNEIRVSISPTSTRDIVVEVRDTGSGMRREVLKRLFTPFFTTKPIGVGTGLGLAICHRIVTGLGGAIAVDSVLGKGTVFRVSLPVQEVARDSPRIVDPPPLKRVRRGRVLVLDDEQAVARAVSRVLEKHHDVVTANRGPQMLAKIAAGERFDVILCDLMMPDMTGMDIHAELLRTAPDQAQKMIFLTGGAFTTHAREFLDEVPNLRLEKPVDSASLLSIINDRIRKA